MIIEVINENPLRIAADALIVPCAQGCVYLTSLIQELDPHWEGMLARVREQGDFEGKLHETRVIYQTNDTGMKRILLVGLGKEQEIDREKIRGAFARALQFARSLRLRSVILEFSYAYPNLSRRDAVACAVEGALLGHYRYLRYKTSPEELDPDVEKIYISERDKSEYRAIKTVVSETKIICEAVTYARDMISAPANDMTPTVLAEKAQEVAKSARPVKCRVLDQEDAKKLGMNAFLGVAKGSHEPPRFIIMEYHGTKKSVAPVVLIGKGLTFDSGGISLKPAEKMEEMKSDMAGAAAIIATFKALGDLKWPINCVGLIAATENLPGGGALKPGDVLRSLSGKTIEVINTDAEGRLTLADALSYATRYRPQVIIDIATLTGACIVALGEQLVGLMGTDASVSEKIKAVAQETGEFVWELPLWEPYEELIKSDIADVKNTGGRPAGTITAGLFLRKFVENYRWAHLDIAGAAWQSKDRPYIPKGASGIGVRLLLRFLQSWMSA